MGEAVGYGKFGLTIDFSKGVSDPAAVFMAMAEFLEGFSKLDELLVGSVLLDAQASHVLDKVEANSITAWVSNALRRTDDDAIRSLEWKKQVGAALVAAKHRTLKYLDERQEKNERARLLQLQADLLTLAGDISPEGVSEAQKIPLKRLVRPLDEIQAAKEKLSLADHVVFHGDSGDLIVDTTATKKPSDFIEDIPEQNSSGEMRMILLVRKPDYLGDAKWEFRHGRNSLSANIEDKDWLDAFHLGKIAILPGSAIVCDVAYEYKYTKNGDLISIKHSIRKIFDVIHYSDSQIDMDKM